MKRYDSYKDSGVEWIGEIPNIWKTVQIKRLCSVKRGSSPRPIDDPKYFDDNGEFNWVRISDVSKSERYLTKTKETLSDLGSSLSTKISLHDIFLSIAGSVGKPIITKIKCCIHDGFVWFDSLIYDKELLYYIFSLGKCFSGLGKMGTQLNLNTESVGMINIPLIPLQEQQQIVSFLDTKTSLIDSLIEKTDRKIELLKEKRTSLINEVVTKGLNPNVEMKDSGVDWIGDIPSHWETTRFKFKGKVIIGLSYKPENQVDESDGVLVMRSSNVQNGKPSFHDNVYVNCKISDKLRTREGDILICSRNGSRRLIGKNCLITKEIEGMSWGVFMTMYRSPHYKFFYWLLNSPVFKSQSGLFLTSTINQLTVSTLENMVVPYVNDKIEQQQIVEYLDEQTGLIDKTISTEEKRIELLKEYRQSLISEVVTGKLKVV